MYGAETWAMKKAPEKKVDVAEMRMLRWMSGVTKLDRIIHERIRGTRKVGEISKKVLESRLKWYGHVLRREDECVGKRVMGMEVPGKEGDEDKSGSGWIASGTTCKCKLLYVGCYITLQCKVIFRTKYIIFCYIIMLKVCVKSTAAILFFHHGIQAHLKFGQLKFQSKSVAC